MSTLSRLRSLWRGLAHRSSFEAEMDEEFRLHLELRTEDLIRAGHSPAEAARRARLDFGATELHKERARASRGLRIFDELYGDVRYGVRTLMRTPGFTIVAVLTLALGIGATTTIFSVADAVMIRPLPFRDAGRLVKLKNVAIPFGKYDQHPDITDIRASSIFEHVEVYAPGGLNLSSGGAPERVPITEITPGFFGMLGVHPVLGRGFVRREGVPNGPRVAIVSWAVWRERLGADTALAGKHVTLNGKDYQVVGVAPRGFVFPDASQVWIPMSIPNTAATFAPFRAQTPAVTVARLAPGVTRSQAEARLAVLFAPLVAQFPEAFGKHPGPWMLPFRASLVGPQRTTLLILLGATGLVLLIACANVANLILSRATVRQREIAVRATLGATPGRVARQLLIESVGLALAGGVVGASLAFFGTHALSTLVPAVLDGSAPVRVDARVLGFALAVALGSGLAFGLLPAFSARRADAAEVLKSGGTGTTSGAPSARMRRGLLLGEVVLTVMLLIGSGIMLRSLRALLDSDPGVHPEHVATLEVRLARADYTSRDAIDGFYTGVVRKLDALPGVESAAWINELPLRGRMGVSWTVFPEGRPPEDVQHQTLGEDLRITPGYFRTMGIRVLKGRGPRAVPGMLRMNKGEVAISESLARRFWPHENPIGKHLSVFKSPFEIVGVVADVKPKTLASSVVPQTYYSMLQSPLWYAALVARGTMPTSVLERRLVQAVHAVAPHQAVYDVHTMDDVISRAIAPRRTNTALITAFGVLALLLAVVGVYGVIAFGVARRTQEIGIRMALGADAGRIRRSVMGEALGVALLGSVLGLGGAWALSGVLRSFVYGVAPTDPISFVAAPMVVLAAAALAAFVPARRATRIDPTDAIREA